MGFLDRITSSVTSGVTSKVSSGVSSEIGKKLKAPDPWTLINVDDYFKKIKITPEKDESYSFSVENDYIGSISASTVKMLKQYSRVKAMGDLKRSLYSMKHKNVAIFRNDKLRLKVSEKFLDMIGVK